MVMVVVSPTLSPVAVLQRQELVPGGLHGVVAVMPEWGVMWWSAVVVLHGEKL